MGKNFEIVKDWTGKVTNVRHITVEWNGNSYSVIFGRYVNGGFCCIPNWAICCELGAFDDVFWNTESLERAFDGDGEVANALAKAICQYAEENNLC